MPSAAIAAAIRDIPDFPKPGIVFKDITPVLRSPQLFREVIQTMAERWRGNGLDAVAAVDARGFIVGGALAYELGVGFIPVRKSGKLPWEVVSETYELEYGSSAIEMHADAVRPGQSVLVVDDLLATGGTAKAACNLIERCGAKVAGIEFIIELCFLNGRAGLGRYSVNSLVQVK